MAKTTRKDGSALEPTLTKRTTAKKQHIACPCPDCVEWAELLRVSGPAVRKSRDEEKAREEKRKAKELAEPPELVGYTDACSAISLLRLYHHQLVERVAAELRPRFEAGELYGNLDTPGGSEKDADGARAILGECRSRIVGREDACITLAFSPSTEAIADEDRPDALMDDATEAFAADVLRVARFRRFYEMKPNESYTLW